MVEVVFGCRQRCWQRLRALINHRSICLFIWEEEKSENETKKNRPSRKTWGGDSLEKDRKKEISGDLSQVGSSNLSPPLLHSNSFQYCDDGQSEKEKEVPVVHVKLRGSCRRDSGPDPMTSMKLSDTTKACQKFRKLPGKTLKQRS